MISAPDRRRAVELIADALTRGVSVTKAYEELQISLRTYRRWSSEGGVRADARPQAERPAPVNKLSRQERRQILQICNQDQYGSLPPSQIVPKLADKGDLYRFGGKLLPRAPRGRSTAPSR